MLVGWFGEVLRGQVTSEQRPKEMEECDTWRPGRKPGAEERAGTEVLRQRPPGCSEGAGGRLRLEACERSRGESAMGVGTGEPLGGWDADHGGPDGGLGHVLA